jgi:hypothetical protein
LPFQRDLGKRITGNREILQTIQVPTFKSFPIEIFDPGTPIKNTQWNMNKQAMSGSAAPQVGEVRLEERPNHHDKPDKSLGLRKIYWIPGIDRKKYAGFSHPLFQKLQVWD